MVRGAFPGGYEPFIAKEPNGSIKNSESWYQFFLRLSKPDVRIQDNYANDAAAEAGGILLGGKYHTSGTVKIRIT